MDVGEWLEGIRKRAESGRPVVTSGKNFFEGFGWESLVFTPSQFYTTPLDYFREKISSETVLGRIAKNPLKLDTPIMIAAMSFGALSKEAKMALAKASSMAGTCSNTGEGGMLPEERKLAKRLIFQYSTGRFGVSEESLMEADAIEVKISQGAKPGQGGLLPKEKVTEEIAKARGVEVGKDVISPPTHPDIGSLEELRERIELLREISGGKPVILKFAATDIDRDVRAAAEANPDVIAIDGGEGGTGAAPEVMMKNVGIPTLVATAKARAILEEVGAKQQLIVGGGISTGGDVAKALALGADGVFVGFPALVAMGCVFCRRCYTGKCPKGIATQEVELRKRLNVDEAAKRVANYIVACTEEVKMIAAACGKKSVHELCKEDLRSLDETVAKLTGVKLVGE